MINKATIQFPFDHGDMQLKAEYSGNYPVYIGRARAGAAVADGQWQIKKITYDANFNVTAIQFASGTNDYDKVWDDRASYIYS
jgi:hypothetical protein